MKQLQLIYSILFLEFCSVIYTSGSYSKDSVPFLIWSNKRQPLDIPAVSAIPIPFSHVEGKYLKLFNQDNVILFQQDTLSVEDVSSHEKTFKHVKEYMENGHSLYLPAVETGTSLLHSFSERDYNIITVEPGSAIGELKLKDGSPNLVLVKLPPTTTNPSRQKALQKSDEIMGNVMSKIGELAPFTVIYTALGPSLKLISKVEHRRVTREAPIPLDNSTAIFFRTNCILLYLKNGLIIGKGNSTFELPNNQAIDGVADCQEYNQSIKINYKDIGEHQKIKVELFFSRFRRSWSFISAQISEMINNKMEEAVDVIPQWPMDHIPSNKSYACGKKLVLISNTTDVSKKDYKLVIEGMQVQAYTGGDKEFDDSWDCVGFFTIPIWMGLFTGMLFTFILLFGLCMLVDIKTMDRFDDPKGKHLVLTGSNE